MHLLTIRLKEELKQLADPEKAHQMQVYMKSDQSFYGVQAPPRRRSFRKVVRDFKTISRPEYQQIIFDLWEGEYREEMYQALEVAEYFKAYRDKESWPIYERLVYLAPHWDTLDWIAGKLISSLILQHRELESHLLKWVEAEQMWVRRASLLAHLHHKEETHVDLLAETILRLAPEKEFFIRKAIGWILRDYSYVNPDWVVAFVDKHQNMLSGLSKREALKRIKRDK